MKQVISILLLFSLLLLACKEDEPTAPEEESTKGDVLAEANIGPEGGILETEDFQLSVPANAFEQSVELKLYMEKKDSLETNSATSFFSVEGLPRNYSQKLKLRLRYNGIPEGQLFIEIGEDKEVIAEDTSYTTMTYILLDAEVDDEYLTAEIEPVAGNHLMKSNRLDDETNKITIEGFFNGLIVSSEHFEIKTKDFDINKHAAELLAILDNFENAKKYIASMEIDNPNVIWPKIINVKDGFGPFIYLHGSNYQHFQIFTRTPSSLTQFNYTVVYYLCASIMSSYDLPDEYDWIRSSISSMACYEHDYWESNSFGVLKNYVGHLFKMSSKPSITFSILLEYLAEQYGIKIIKQIIEQVQNGKDPRLAIIDHVANHKIWQSEFYKFILTSETWKKRAIHNSGSILDVCKENWSAEFGIEDSTTVIKWTETYKDLSAKLYRVNLLPGLNEESGLKFSVEGGDAEISLFKYKGSEIEFITSSEKSDSISNIKSLADNGYQLIALVANRMPDYPNFTNSNIELKIEHKNVKSLLKITSCAISLLDIDLNIRKYGDDGTHTDDVYERFWTFFSTEGEPAQEPTFENNIFSQAYTFTDNQGFYVMGNMSIEFNKDMDTILTFSAQYKVDKTDVNPLYGTLEKSISGSKIPLVPSFDNDEYSVSGLAVCEALNDLKYSQTGGGSVDWDIISIRECRPDSDQWPSSLIIKLTKE